MDFSAIRSRLAGSEGRLYWRSLGELADTPEFREYLHREFPEQASEWNDPKGRRDFLKLMSASLALAGVGACTRQPEEQIIPYVRQPEDIVPGRPLFFASAVVHRGYAQPGAGREPHGASDQDRRQPGASGQPRRRRRFMQASILDLYDPDRAKTVTFRGEVRSWSNFLTAAQSALSTQKGRQGAGLRFLAGPITSPSAAEIVATIARDYPQAKWHQWDPTGLQGTLAEATTRFTTSTRPTSSCRSTPISCRTARAACATRRISPTRRRITDDRKEMNRLYVVESTPTLTGAKADHRLPVKASEIQSIASALSAAIGAASAPSPDLSAGASAKVEPRVPSPGQADTAKWVAAIAKDLQAHRGKCVIVPGEFQPAAVHDLARSMNEALGNAGTTVTYGGESKCSRWTGTPHSRNSPRAMEAGQVEVLVILGGNPVFTAPGGPEVRREARQSGARRLLGHPRRRDRLRRALESAGRASPRELGGLRAPSTAPSPSRSR